MMQKYKELMFSFSREDLKMFLGKEMIDTLIEWTPSGEELLTKDRLIEMIDLLHGTSILKRREFRKALLIAMSKREIAEVGEKCLGNQYDSKDEPINVVNKIVSKTWGNNKVSKYLIDIWEYPTDIFESQEEDTAVKNEIDPASRFFELLDYQYYIRQRALNNLNSDNLQERMLIHMPTGTGKTKTTMHIIANYYAFSLKNKGLVLWVAHTSELLLQAYETFVDVWRHLGNQSISTYKLWGTRAIDPNEELNGICFCGLSKLMSIKENNPALFERLKEDCRLLVFDEAHKAAATKTKHVIEDLLRMPKGYKNRALIGLTATPGRTTLDTTENNLLSNMFGNKLIGIDEAVLNQINYGRLQALNKEEEENIIKYFQKRHILAKMTAKRLRYQTTFSEQELQKINHTISSLELDETDFSPEQLKIFAMNKARNKVIMENLRQLYSDGIPTIVFACSVSHAKMLSAMLSLEDIPNSMVVGDMPLVEREKAISDFKNSSSNINIIINYEVLTTGFDATNIGCVFITRPTKSIVLYSQMLGRGLRGPMMGGNEECLLIDVDDNLESFNNDMAFSHFDNYWRR